MCSTPPIRMSCKYIVKPAPSRTANSTIRSTSHRCCRQRHRSGSQQEPTMAVKSSDGSSGAIVQASCPSPHGSNSPRRGSQRHPLRRSRGQPHPRPAAPGRTRPAGRPPWMKARAEAGRNAPLLRRLSRQKRQRRGDPLKHAHGQRDCRAAIRSTQLMAIRPSQLMTAIKLTSVAAARKGSRNRTHRSCAHSVCRGQIATVHRSPRADPTNRPKKIPPDVAMPVRGSASVTPEALLRVTPPP
jgi:hypothetical protein